MQVKGKNVVLGVSGGISAYKAVEVLRRLTEKGVNVRVVMTKAATEFVTPLTFRELSYHHVAVEMFEEPKGPMMQHLGWMEWADLFVIAPATANVINKMACGIADNLLMTMALSCTCPILIAPAMDSDMYTNPITQANIAKLKQLGVHFVGPATGPLARRNVGPGRLADPKEIAERALELLASGATWRRSALEGWADLKHLHILVTAGPTHEAIDPVRYIVNRSSGKMGYAIAEAAAERGARVTLVSGPTALPAPRGVERVDVESAVQMRDAVMARLPGVDVVIKAAAVADYRVREISAEKIKKEASGDELTLQLVRNPDIAAEVGKVKRPDQTLVVFAAETSDLVEQALRKLREKKADLAVANDVTEEGAGFGVDTNKVHLVFGPDRIEQLPLMSKRDVADRILDGVVRLRKEAGLM